MFAGRDVKRRYQELTSSDLSPLPISHSAISQRKDTYRPLSFDANAVPYSSHRDSIASSSTTNQQHHGMPTLIEWHNQSLQSAIDSHHKQPLSTFDAAAEYVTTINIPLSGSTELIPRFVIINIICSISAESTASANTIATSTTAAAQQWLLPPPPPILPTAAAQPMTSSNIHLQNWLPSSIHLDAHHQHHIVDETPTDPTPSTTLSNRNVYRSKSGESREPEMKKTTNIDEIKNNRKLDFYGNELQQSEYCLVIEDLQMMIVDVRKTEFFHFSWIEY